MISKQRYINYFLFTLLLIPVITACNDEPDYSMIPHIEYESYRVLPNDSGVILTISYLDGDGNLGLDEKHQNPPFDTSSEYFNNIFVNYYERVDGEFRQVSKTQWDTAKISFHGRFPDLTPEGKNKTIKGEIEYDIIFIGFEPGENPQNNFEGYIKFEVYIYDRELNKSNVITTPAIPIID